MAQVTLIAFLQQPLAAVPVHPPPQPGRNTTNQAYSYLDIQGLQIWQSFNLETILQQYQNVLNGAVIAADPMPVSPPRPITAENVLQAQICEILRPRIRRSLRVGFAFLANNGGMQGQTELCFDVGESARAIENYKPDTAYFDIHAAPAAAPNRAPGDVKPSWKWRTDMRGSQIVGQRNEYRQALSQVNFYMNQHNSRYGFLVSNQELVAIRKLDQNGNLELAQPILWTTGGTATQPRLTVMLGLWYIGMLASHDQGVNNWQM
ncbi:hypothetical protein FQN50_008758 [Emmonsiellopsis sp. PD_5]|nr:hypothetical protein FQN50_008758 [Emmonsiellopsis sp. PD_5]